MSGLFLLCRRMSRSELGCGSVLHDELVQISFRCFLRCSVSQRLCQARKLNDDWSQFYSRHLRQFVVDARPRRVYRLVKSDCRCRRFVGFAPTIYALQKPGSPTKRGTDYLHCSLRTWSCISGNKEEIGLLQQGQAPRASAQPPLYRNDVGGSLGTIGSESKRCCARLTYAESVDL